MRQGPRRRRQCRRHAFHHYASAHLSFSNVGAVSDLIASSAVERASSVTEGKAPDDAGVADRVRALIDQHVWPRYTMVGERTVHQAAVRRYLLAETDDAPAVVVEKPGVDELLF